MKITLIAAVDDMFGIGKDNTIVWQNDEDMRHFRQYTEGKVVVMGRKTWDSLPTKPLPMRENWILSRDSDYRDLLLSCPSSNNFEIFSDIEDMVGWADFKEYEDNLQSSEICIIGGQSIYEQFMPHATHLVITRIKGNYHCDRFFPVIDESWQRYDIDVKDTCRIEYYKLKDV